MQEGWLNFSLVGAGPAARDGRERHPLKCLPEVWSLVRLNFKFQNSNFTVKCLFATLIRMLRGAFHNRTLPTFLAPFDGL